MGTLILRYIAALLCGIVLGFMFPAFASWWLLLFLLGAFLVSEFIGNWGFGAMHWSAYRPSCYLLYTALVPCLVVGILLGSGKLGALLVFLGKAISR